MRRTTITLSEELGQLVEDEARRTETSVSAVVRRALELRFYPAGGREIGFAGICNRPDLPPARSLDEALGEWEHELDRDR